MGKIRSVSPAKVAEVEDFADFLRQRDEVRRLTQAAARLSEGAAASGTVKAWSRRAVGCGGGRGGRGARALQEQGT